MASVTSANVCVHLTKKEQKLINYSDQIYKVLHTKTVLIMTCLIPRGLKAELALGFLLVVVFLGLRIDS